MRLPIGLLATVLTILVVSCAPAQNQGQSADRATDRPSQARTLLIAHRYEHVTLTPKVLQSNGSGNNTRLFNAALSLIDDQGASRPYLAEALPQLGSDTWLLLPNGHMETTYRLRANLTWQDGTPLTAEDFVFARRTKSTLCWRRTRGP